MFHLISQWFELGFSAIGIKLDRLILDMKLHRAPVFGYMICLAMLADLTSGDLLGEGLSG
jgi:hypothetical protein